MKSNLKFDFIVDKKKNSIFISRELNAKLDLVWDAWTKPEIMDQWWAPKPWKSKTKYMNFHKNGSRLYAMIGPENEEHWGITEFTSVTPKTNFTFRDSFCDSEGIINTQFPSSSGVTSFDEDKKLTTVKIEMNFASLADLEANIKMGFKEGMTMALSGLDDILEKLNK